MRQIVVFAFMLIGMGANAQYMGEKDLERTACESLAKEIYPCSKDSMHIVEFDVATDIIAFDISLCYEECEPIETSNNHGKIIAEERSERKLHPAAR